MSNPNGTNWFGTVLAKAMELMPNVPAAVIGALIVILSFGVYSHLRTVETLAKIIERTNAVIEANSRVIGDNGRILQQVANRLEALERAGR